MQLTERNHWGYISIGVIKSFLLWNVILAVCLLVVGFPLVVLMMTVGALSAIVLHSVLPVSSVLLVAGTIVGLNLLAVAMGAMMLTAKGIYPHEVHWLRWLHGDAKPSHEPVYASCPLTCGILH
ncbi:hypothetical protein V0288_21890 [Pannus brasiliensis CCIBt3594]|uniref:Uncharacterized protein n=1 Tax=Pannus brasiliensis CCIBt3594 TaxID=1427578 RepID=A0AAW9QWM6_9CHRO